MPHLPPWIRTSFRTDGRFPSVCAILAEQALHTVCVSARCPNRAECWNRGTATFMILGDRCTRHCRFCAVEHGTPAPPDPDEPRRVAAAARAMDLRHVVLTSVTRDDLADGGAQAFAETVRALRRELPGATVEVLTPDFAGDGAAVDVVLDSGPDVFSHNLETVERLQALFRPQADYRRSLEVLRRAAERPAAPVVKSGLLVGMGETDEEIEGAMRDLWAAGCRVLTLGQYLAPSRDHLPVARFVTPAEFERLAQEARRIGFAAVRAGPLVRSSYRAEELLREAEMERCL